MLYRFVSEKLKSKIGTGKALVLIGPRQVGKTTLLKNIVQHYTNSFLWLNCDDPTVKEELESANLASLRTLTQGKKLVIIDEAQRVKDIGLKAKLFTDELKDTQLILSGSSALELGDQLNEPLTGRKWEYTMYPICWQELVETYGLMEAKQQLEQRMIYGMYPEVVNSPGSEYEILTQLASSYLFKDLLSYQGIRKPDLLEKLLKALALQIGQEVSYNELAGMLNVDKNTINQYLQLLEQAYIIIRLHPFARNLRNEVNTTRKIYFVDTGIRNMLIGNFNGLSLRQDKGALWENFLVMERLKCNTYKELTRNRYFWRTQAQQEIDYIEEYGGALHAYEFKYASRKTARFSKTFTQAYPETRLETISTQNYANFLAIP